MRKKTTNKGADRKEPALKKSVPLFPDYFLPFSIEFTRITFLYKQSICEHRGSNLGRKTWKPIR